MHFYDEQGNAAYFQPNKSKGGSRPTTVRDAKKLNLFPSVTTIINDVLRKPGLEQWKERQAILSALTCPAVWKDGELLDVPEAELIKIVKADSWKQVQDAMDEGSAIHDAVENHFKNRMVPPSKHFHVTAVVKCLNDQCGKQEWYPEVPFRPQLGYGGRVDLYSKDWVIDFKTKDLAPTESARGWDEQLLQLTAYRDALLKEGKINHDAKLANLFISRTHPGTCVFWPWENQDNIESASRRFRHLLNYWCETKKFFPEGVHHE